jgi:HEAT repeats
VVLLGALLGARRALGAPANRTNEICRSLGDPNYKVRVQAALVLGKLGDAAGVPCLSKALGDSNRTVRAMAAQALGQVGDASALDSLRALLKRDPDSFVKVQAEKAVAMLSGPTGGPKKLKMYLSFGPFTGGIKSAPGESVKVVHDTLQTELGKLPVVSLVAPPESSGKTGAMAFWIDGNITRLDESAGGASSEISCGVKVMVARWPSKSIISWTSAEASVQAGTRPRDRESARRECLEATATQLAEDLAKFFKSQGG